MYTIEDFGLVLMIVSVFGLIISVCGYFIEKIFGKDCLSKMFMSDEDNEEDCGENM